MSTAHSAPEPLKRFYTRAGVGPAQDGRSVVLLDGRPVRTPARALLDAPTPIATAVAAEWEAQGTHILPLTMPLTRLANTAIDGVADAVDRVQADIAAMAENDLVIYRADRPDGLVNEQTRHWDPIVAFAERTLGVRIVLAEGVMPVAQDARLNDAVRAVLPADPLALAALHQLTTLTGSAFLTLALLRAELRFAAAWAAAHVDEDWNVRLWGEDEEAAARRAIRQRDAAAAAFVLGVAVGAGSD